VALGRSVEGWPELRRWPETGVDTAGSAT
jgi:hypothetical protein